MESPMGKIFMPLVQNLQMRMTRFIAVNFMPISKNNLQLSLS